MARHRRLLPVVEAGATHPRIREREPGGLDEIDTQTETRRHAQDRAGVLRDVRFEEGEAHANHSQA